MPKSSKVLLVSIAALVILSSASSFVLFAGRRPNTPVPITAAQQLVEQRLSGTYKGTIYRQKNKMQGTETTLYIYEDNKFLMQNADGTVTSGVFQAWIIPEKDNLGVAKVTIANQAPIELRWNRDPCRDTLKILHAQGSKRYFRFCSANLKVKEECFGTVAPSCRGAQTNHD